METKTVIVNKNWLDDVDGMPVHKAIEYLSKLNPDHILSYYMEGDTHGCNVVSNLHYKVPMTNKEILVKLENHYLKEITTYERAKEGHVKANRVDRIDSCSRLLKQLYDKLEEARAKYKS